MVYNFRPVPNTDQGWSGIDTPGLLLETMVWYRHPWSIIRDHGLVSTPLVYYQRPWSDNIEKIVILQYWSVIFRPWSIIFRPWSGIFRPIKENTKKIFYSLKFDTFKFKLSSGVATAGLLGQMPQLKFINFPL